MHAHFVSFFSERGARWKDSSTAADSGRPGQTEDLVGGRLSMATRAQRERAASQHFALRIELEVAPNAGVFAHDMAVAGAAVESSASSEPSGNTVSVTSAT